MTITLVQAANLFNFFREIQNLKLPIRTAYKISQLKKELDFHINFYLENLNKITLEYAQIDENGAPCFSGDGQGVLIKTENIQECTKKIEELGNLTVELSDTASFTLSDFNEIELTLQSFEALLPFIKE